MENLREKVDDASNAQLVNIFQIARKKFGRRFSEWNEYAQYMYVQQIIINGSYKKSNRKAETIGRRVWILLNSRCDAEV